MIIYDAFWKTLENKGISQYVLINKYNISTSLLDSLRHNKSISMNTLNNLCQILDCDVQDIVSYIPDDSSK